MTPNSPERAAAREFKKFLAEGLKEGDTCGTFGAGFFATYSEVLKNDEEQLALILKTRQQMKRDFELAKVNKPRIDALMLELETLSPGSAEMTAALVELGELYGPSSTDWAK